MLNFIVQEVRDHSMQECGVGRHMNGFCNADLERTSTFAEAWLEEVGNGAYQACEIDLCG